MPKAAKLSTLNNALQELLKCRDYKNAKIKQTLKACKLQIYGNPAIEQQSSNYAYEALRFSELNLTFVLATRNSKEYEIAINNVRYFYDNAILPTKHETNSQIIAINLLFLLSTNRNEEFYAKLESLTNHNLNDKYVEYVLSLNDAIEEGNYRKVFQLKKINPLEESFAPFLDTISETIRTEVAKSAEKAYSELSLKEAISIFQFENVNQFQAFVEQYVQNAEEHNIKWVITNDKVIFEKEASRKVKFNSDDLIKTSLQYAVELEKIA